MPTMDSTAEAALVADFARADFVFIDFSGDPLRITTHGQNITFSGTGDPDLDGFTFQAFDGRALSVSQISNGENGSEPLVIELSGIVTIDTQTLADIANRALWQGRLVRTWFGVYSASGAVQQGAIVSEYTGYASSVDVLPSPETQRIQLRAENYLAAFNDPSRRTYLGQKDYDSGDLSAAASIAAANTPRQPQQGGGGGGNSDDWNGYGPGPTGHGVGGAGHYIN